MRSSPVRKAVSLQQFLLLLTLLLCGAAGRAQPELSNPLSSAVTLHTGYMLPEYPFIGALTEDYIRSVDVSLFRETVGRSEWDQLYNYPSYGLSLFYSSLGNEAVFGREAAMNAFCQLYHSAPWRRFRVYNRIGLGLGYVTRKYDPQRNPLNVAVASHLNIHFNFRVGAEYALTERLGLTTGLSFDHFSNANTSEPNLGLNYLTGYGGVSYRWGEKTAKRVHQLAPHSPRNEWALFASLGGKRTRALASNYYLTASLSVEFTRSLSRKFHLGVGGDLFYDASVRISLEKQARSYRPSDHFQTGIHLSQSLVYHRLALTIQEGVYIGLTEQVNDYPIYTRGIVRYQFSDRLLFRFAMKAHLHILDYPELGFGYLL